ncbi:toxin-antitoxin system HicB family antitoxin [Agromyces bauzanensis]|uniref:toxin-antitoxin system HicB family antitoxin n=1 Tax=Agromyces bauzanensis TaxID=1308924 RepID=UPI00166DC65B
MNLRVDPAVHRKLAAEALRYGTSLNAFAARLLDQLRSRKLPKHGRPLSVPVAMLKRPYQGVPHLLTGSVKNGLHCHW